MEPSNSERAGRALSLLRDYARYSEADDEPLDSLLGDLFTDLRHLAEREGLDVEGAVSLSALHFDAERNNRPRSILNPRGRKRIILADCPYCRQDHTSWHGCILAEVGGRLQDQGWSTVEIVEAIRKISVKKMEDLLSPVVGLVDEQLPTQEQLEQQERDDFEQYGPSEAQLRAYHGR